MTMTAANTRCFFIFFAILFHLVYGDDCPRPRVAGAEFKFKRRPDNEIPDMTQPGATVVMKCRIGNLVGQNESVCQRNGRFEPPFGSCSSFQCKVPYLRDGRYGEYEPDDTVAAGTFIMPVCSSGYEFHGPRQRSCQPDGSWTGAEPQCQWIPVQPLPETPLPSTRVLPPTTSAPPFETSTAPASTATTHAQVVYIVVVMTIVIVIVLILLSAITECFTVPMCE